MHPVSMPVNSTLAPVQTQKKKLSAGNEEEEQELPIQGVLVGPDVPRVCANKQYSALCGNTEEEELSREEGRRSGRGVALMHRLLQHSLCMFCPNCKFFLYLLAST